ncbi:MAG: flagellar motor switch protein FliM [Anaerofustis sp.]
MAEVLSQQQIDELLGNLLSGDVDLDEIKEQTGKTKVKEYDFRSPKKFTREQVKLLGNIHENFAKLSSSQLSNLLRLNFEMEVLQTEEQQFYEFNNALEDSVLMGFIDLQKNETDEDRQQIIMEIARPISFFIIDRLLGGAGGTAETYAAIDRGYTDIELSLMKYFLCQFVAIIKHSWSNYFEVDPALDYIETNSRMIQSISPDETVVIVVMEVTIEDLVGTINICLPKTTLDIIFKAFETKFAKPVRVGGGSDAKSEIRRKAIMDKLNDSPLQMKGILGKTEITLQELLNLEVGDVIPLGTSTESNKILVNVENIPWFYGSFGTKNNKYAVKIMEQY